VLELQPPDVRVGHPPSTTPYFFFSLQRGDLSVSRLLPITCQIAICGGLVLSVLKPGIIARLSHLIVIQVLFIFAALALILLYLIPSRSHQVG